MGYPVSTLEERTVELRRYNVKDNFWLFNLKCEQAIEINLAFSLAELKDILKMAEKMKASTLKDVKGASRARAKGKIN